MVSVITLVRLKGVRERRALTQQQLAEKAGVNRVTIARLERGKDQPFPTTVRKLADALRVDPADLMAPPHDSDGERAPAASAQPGLDPAARPDGRLKIVDAPGVNRFLREHPELAPLVAEAADRLGRLIADAWMRLELLVDPDYGDTEQLFLGVCTSLPENEALEVLRRFDQAWWVHNARRGRGLLCIDLIEA